MLHPRWSGSHLHILLLHTGRLSRAGGTWPLPCTCHSWPPQAASAPSTCLYPVHKTTVAVASCSVRAGVHIQCACLGGHPSKQSHTCSEIFHSSMFAGLLPGIARALAPSSGPCMRPRAYMSCRTKSDPSKVLIICALHGGSTESCYYVSYHQINDPSFIYDRISSFLPHDSYMEGTTYLQKDD